MHPLRKRNPHKAHNQAPKDSCLNIASLQLLSEVRFVFNFLPHGENYPYSYEMENEHSSNNHVDIDIAWSE